MPPSLRKPLGRDLIWRNYLRQRKCSLTFAVRSRPQPTAQRFSLSEIALEIVDPSLASCSKEDAPQSSYPSGHATMGFSMGVVLASLIPEKAQLILRRATEYAENRLVCGMHFRRDIQAGQTLGTVIATELMQSPSFRVDFDAAALELRAHLVTRLAIPSE